MNQMIQMMKQLSGRLSSNIYTSVHNQNSASQIAFLRQMQRELKKEDVLNMPFSKVKFIVFDIETTGFYPDQGDRILSIGAVKMQGSEILEKETFYSLIHASSEPPEEIQVLTGLRYEELQAAPPIESVLTEFYSFVRSDTLVAHHASHEKKFMQHITWNTLRTHFQHRLLDTSFLTKIVAPKENLITLEDCCTYYDITVTKRHHALNDALMTAELWSKNIEKILSQGFETLSDVYSHLAKNRAV